MSGDPSAPFTDQVSCAEATRNTSRQGGRPSAPVIETVFTSSKKSLTASTAFRNAELASWSNVPNPSLTIRSREGRGICASSGSANWCGQVTCHPGFAVVAPFGIARPCEVMPENSSTSPRKPEPSTHGPARAQIHANWVVYFYEVVRCGSVRAAARKLNVAPSAISRQIKDLEAQLGTQLLEKTSTRLRPTAAGEAVARHASNVIKDLSYTRAVVADLNGLRRGHVSIVAAQATSTDFLPHAISELKNRFPRVSFDCDFTGTANIVPRLIDGTADVGVAFQISSDSRVRNVISVERPSTISADPSACTGTFMKKLTLA